MHYTYTIEINSPISKVVDLFMNTDKMKEWQEGFKSKELISGKPSEVGAKSRILYKTKHQDMELIETIISNNLPKEINAIYDHIHMSNRQRTCFYAMNENQTKMEINIEDVKFNSFLPKLMSVFMRGAFEKQSRKWFDNFKALAENKK